MAPGELLEADLTRRAKFVGTNDRLPTDERAEIDARELLGASRAKRRVRYVARRTLDGTEPAGRASIAQSGHDRTVDRRVMASTGCTDDPADHLALRVRHGDHEVDMTVASVQAGRPRDASEYGAA